MPDFPIRLATITDVPALTALHVKTWNATYNVQPNQGPSIETRTWQWNQFFNEKKLHAFVLVMENEKGELIGFTKAEPYSHAHLPQFNGELNKIYLLKEYHKQGLGKRLLAETVQHMIANGMTNMVLFGSPDNPTNAFHEAMGGQKLINPKQEFDGGYYWMDLQKLLERCLTGD